MSKVPAGWVNTKLQNIAKIKSGSTPLRAKGTRYFTQNGTPWVKTLDLNNSEIHITDEEITDLALKETSCTLFPANTVLVAMYGGFNQIGRTGLITKPSASNQALSGLILNEEIADPKYVLNYLNGNVSKWKEFAASSRKDPNITRDDVCNFPILLPPLPEQTKIAKILSTWDKAIATTEKLIGNSQQQKKALMQSLLTGKKRLPGFEGEWSNTTLEDCCYINPRKAPRPENGLVSFISMDSVSESAKLLKTEVRNYDDVEKGFTSFSIRDVLVAKITPCFENGKGAYLDKLINEIGFGSTEFHVLRSKVNTSSKFIYFITNTDEFRVRGEANMQGSAGQKRVTTDYLKLYPVKLPPLPEQQKIAAILTAADNEIDLLQKKLTFLKQEKAALMQQLLTGKRRVKVEAA